MRISRVSISNFRSIRELELELEPYVVIIGPNNHGKSNILKALEFALTPSYRLSPDDFFRYSNERKSELYVEITFTELTEQEKRTFEKYLLEDESFRIRKAGKINKDGKVEVFYRGYVFSKEEGATSLEESNFLGRKNVAAGILPDFYLIPAVQDVSDELKIKTTTMMGKLLSRILDDAIETDASLSKAREYLERAAEKLTSGGPNSAIEKIKGDLREELKNWGVEVLVGIEPPSIDKLLEQGFKLELDDGVPTTTNRKGHGLQRAVLFALLRAWVRALKLDSQKEDDSKPIKPRKKSDTVVFAIEEPELYLHPQAQKRFADLLRTIAAEANNQVLLTTHSPYFLKLEKHQEIVLVSKPDAGSGTVAHQVSGELFSGESLEEKKKRFRLAHWINPDRSEMFFAKKVVFVEGETEKVALPYIAHKIGIYDPEVSIIDCGSKFNLPLYIEIANSFGLKYIVVHDEDPLPDPIPPEWPESKIREKERTFELNEAIKNMIDPDLGSVEVLSPDIEGVLGVSRSQGAKKGKALAAIEQLEATTKDELPDRIVEVVRAIYEDHA